ncbi:UvrB/UvrC motif-containing protein [bacterium]|nr:UvrB/UvrC motif-containing protein [bacterium]
MNKQPDIRELLEQWPYDPEDNVRLAKGADGRDLLQVRLPLGIEQHELEGRPDGQRPHGAASAFDHQLQRFARAKAAGSEGSFGLSAEDCAELFGEGVLYYYRYLHLFQIQDWRRTLRDTRRNQRLFDFVRDHARREEDQLHLEQWRPYLLRMHAVAGAMLELEHGRHGRAREIVSRTLTQIEELPEIDEPTFKFERQRSREALHELVAQIEKSQPLSESELLERQLSQAVEAEEFEKAAQLRDRLRALKEKAAGSQP